LPLQGGTTCHCKEMQLTTARRHNLSLQAGTTCHCKKAQLASTMRHDLPP